MSRSGVVLAERGCDRRSWGDPSAASPPASAFPAGGSPRPSTQIRSTSTGSRSGTAPARHRVGGTSCRRTP